MQKVEITSWIEALTVLVKELSEESSRATALTYAMAANSIIDLLEAEARSGGYPSGNIHGILVSMRTAIMGLAGIVEEGAPQSKEKHAAVARNEISKLSLPTVFNT